MVKPESRTISTAVAGRSVARIIKAQRTLEGAGFVVRRPFPSRTLEQHDPFLMLDEMGPADFKPGESVGAPDHPHRGFETVTYVLEGAVHHEDSAGNGGIIRAGDVQWMTAGRGIIHSEIPKSNQPDGLGRNHGFQVWVNLPARDKMMEPRYQEVPSAKIPEARSEDGLATVRVIAGEALGAHAVIDTRTPILYQDWRLEPGASVDQAMPEGWNGFAYVYDGGLKIGDDARSVVDGDMAILSEGGRVRLSVPKTATGGARLLLLGGKPLNEPMARYGPFVMNTQKQILEAVEDYQTGRFAAIKR